MAHNNYTPDQPAGEAEQKMKNPPVLFIFVLLFHVPSILLFFSYPAYSSAIDGLLLRDGELSLRPPISS